MIEVYTSMTTLCIWLHIWNSTLSLFPAPHNTWQHLNKTLVYNEFTTMTKFTLIDLNSSLNTIQFSSQVNNLKIVLQEQYLQLIHILCIYNYNSMPL